MQILNYSLSSVALTKRSITTEYYGLSQARSRLCKFTMYCRLYRFPTLNLHAGTCGLPWYKQQFYVYLKIPVSSNDSFIHRPHKTLRLFLEGEPVFEAEHVFDCTWKQNRDKQVTLAMGSLEKHNLQARNNVSWSRPSLTASCSWDNTRAQLKWTRQEQVGAAETMVEHTSARGLSAKTEVADVLHKKAGFIEQAVQTGRSNWPII